MIIIDGSKGEGGGQIFRTSLTLAMCLGESVHIKNIRAGRKKPGLLRQHLACLKASQEICSAKVLGAELGSQEVKFTPGKVAAGQYQFSVGSAGSTTLIFQTIMPALASADSSSEVVFEGGTHNAMAPSYDFIVQAFLPLMRRMGYRVQTEMERVGFNPFGGGRWRAKISPLKSIEPLVIMERGKVLEMQAVVSQAKITEVIADRQLQYVKKKLGWQGDQLRVHWPESHGSGTILSLRVAMENLIEVFESIGEKALSAERVAGRAISAFKHYQNKDAPVGEYLADQLIVPMVLGLGGKFRACYCSEHLQTNIEVVKRIADARVELVQNGADDWLVSVL